MFRNTQTQVSAVAINTPVLLLLFVVIYIYICVLTGSLLAGGEGIPDIAGRAAADRIVIHHVALGIDAAHTAATGVGALGVEACQGRRTVAVEDTLGPTAGRRPEVAGQAGTDRALFGNAALGVGAARRRLAGVGHHRHWRSDDSSCENLIIIIKHGFLQGSLYQVRKNWYGNYFNYPAL